MTQSHSEKDARLFTIREAAALMFPDDGESGLRRLRGWVDHGFIPTVQHKPRGQHFIHADELGLRAFAVRRSLDQLRDTEEEVLRKFARDYGK